jgi:Flp pilus assembly protein CpaB
VLNPERHRALRSLAWRLRWAFAALFAALLVRVALPGVVEAANGGRPVVVLVGAVEAGAILQEEDLRIAHVPSSLVPDTVLTQLDDAVGQSLRVPLGEGTVLQEGLLTAAGRWDEVPAGRVAAAVRLSDPGMAALVGPGDLVDIMASAGMDGGRSIVPAQVLAHSALVLGAPSGATDGAAGLIGGLGAGLISGADAQDGLLLVAVTSAEAELIGGAASWAVISAVRVG